nr:hypothetical protein [Halovivax gelatinilyticus]
MIADVAPTTFLGDPADADRARLELRFWYPTGVDHEYYRINWIEPERNVMLGFHRDADHADLGPCHVQLNFEDAAVDRYSASFLDSHPLSVLDERLQQLPSAIDSIRWEGETPSLPGWPV